METASSGGWRSWLGFSAMTAGMFLAILDIQIVASSLLDIQLSLKIPGSRLSYIQTTYLIAEVIAIALSGWLTRVMSTRWLFVAAIIGFVLASIGCALSTSYWMLYVFRFIQGLFGGAVIPLVFSAAFLMFPPHRQSLATLIGGGFAMLAPTVGPYVGGWITETLSWHWLFLINVLPGVVIALIVGTCVKVDAPDWKAVRTLDTPALLLIVVFLTTLELTLKEAPQLGWLNRTTLLLAAICVLSGVVTVLRCLRQQEPLVDFSVFNDRTFAVGAWFSFVLGMALFAATYLLPLFLGIVRNHGPLEIGTIMMVTGVAQLLTAPFATVAEQRVPPRIMTLFGYALLATGLIWNGVATYAWDYDELFVPQILRGAAFMLCLLPVTRLALGQLAPGRVANASALFNLMRNIGGAVGLALIDTIVETRSPHHVENIVARLQAGDRDMAAFVGLSLERFTGTALAPIDPATQAMVEPLVRRAAAVASFNDCWMVLGMLVAISLLTLPLMKHRRAE
jgi:DHA2 family multidrug resistance protein